MLSLKIQIRKPWITGIKYIYEAQGQWQTNEIAYQGKVSDEGGRLGEEQHCKTVFICRKQSEGQFSHLVLKLYNKMESTNGIYFINIFFFCNHLLKWNKKQPPGTLQIKTKEWPIITVFTITLLRRDIRYKTNLGKKLCTRSSPFPLQIHWTYHKLPHTSTQVMAIKIEALKCSTVSLSNLKPRMRHMNYIVNGVIYDIDLTKKKIQDIW